MEVMEMEMVEKASFIERRTSIITIHNRWKSSEVLTYTTNSKSP
jgi:hypothetical protein